MTVFIDATRWPRARLREGSRSLRFDERGEYRKHSRLGIRARLLVEMVWGVVNVDLHTSRHEQGPIRSVPARKPHLLGANHEPSGTPAISICKKALSAKRDRSSREGRIQKGDPAEIILLHARSLRPDVIVMGTHQHRGIERLRVRSMAERVITKAIVPVLLVPRGRHTSIIRPFSHVAVAVDFSAGTNGAVEQALALASDPADRITLLHTVAHSSSRVPRHLYGYGIVETHDPVIREARRRLQQLADLAKRQTPAAVHTSVLLGDATTEISRVVDGIGADLLVVGVSKRGVVSRALFGTTAARLLRATRVPMLAVPQVGTARTHQERASLQLAA